MLYHTFQQAILSRARACSFVWFWWFGVWCVWLGNGGDGSESAGLDDVEMDDVVERDELVDAVG